MKYFSTLALLSLILLVFNGCLKDTVSKRYVYFRPVYSTKESVRANIKSAAPQGIVSPGKLFVKDNYIYLNEIDRGVHVIDYSNPANPKNVAFIAIPGNEDIAVQGDYLYADEYTDLVTLDISNPLSVKLANVAGGAFPDRYYIANPDDIIVSWVKVDTTVKGTDNSWWKRQYVNIDFANNPAYLASSATSPGKAGTGGSMARFALLNDRLYTVSSSTLNVFTIANPANPAFVQNVSVSNWGIETIYPFKDNLFIGSSNGMYIYNTSNPDAPVQAGEFVHARSCDPVIADGDYAYVTLHSGSLCEGFENELEVLDVKNPANASLLKVYPFTNPQGLSKDGSNLFICDGMDGLKILNAADPLNIKPVVTINGFEAFDVIAVNNTAIVSAKDGLYLIDYTSPSNAHIAGKLLISQ